MVEWQFALLVMFGGVVGFLLLGLPVVFSFLTVNIIGALIFLGGDLGLLQMVRNMRSAVAQYALVPIPLFVLMGEVMLHTGMAARSINAIDRVISRVPGRLSMVAVIGGTVFSSLSGSTLANAAVLGKTLLPEMRARGYAPTIAIGPILAVGGVAMLIPPSGLAVMLGSLARISINDLLLTAIVPGILMAIAFFAYIAIRCRMNPALAPAYEVEALPLRDRLMPLVKYVLPLVGIFVVVVGSMMTGVATPTESAALGVIASVIAGACYRSVTLANMKEAVIETLKFSAMILFVICASGTFSQILAFSGATQAVADLVTTFGLAPLAMTVAMLSVLVLLGCFMDQVSMMMLTLPVFMPIIAATGIDPLWFGVLMLIALEISLCTPPFGLLLFVMQGVAGRETPISTIYAAVVPFLILEFAVMALLVIFPGLVQWLPDLLR
ncbi:TRAP transporter large permease (plasmid) [Paroceanicella profunda]|uniref:TRAP transporter large permease protein n=1 Tax=Paroceanicella profunda TaxID=2579971 RepID=A0A5B8G1W5_9RHOB|nr:TRAP transporter large permease [Paroceanicella profunda]QDL94665.1 TRAP transporter large permease [Paroceanicella profunda]